jgi:hypothetical protein
MVSLLLFAHTPGWYMRSGATLLRVYPYGLDRCGHYCVIDEDNRVVTVYDNLKVGALTFTVDPTQGVSISAPDFMPPSFAIKASHQSSSGRIAISHGLHTLVGTVMHTSVSTWVSSFLGGKYRMVELSKAIPHYGDLVVMTGAGYLQLTHRIGLSDGSDTISIGALVPNIVIDDEDLEPEIGSKYMQIGRQMYENQGPVTTYDPRVLVRNEAHHGLFQDQLGSYFRPVNLTDVAVISGGMKVKLIN